MTADPNLVEISFDGVGVRNSQKRLRSLISDLAIEPLKKHQDTLSGQFDRVEEIILKRVASVITYWCQHKHDPVSPKSQDMMGEITNSSKNDITLAEFYANEVRSALHTLAPILDFEVPEDYSPRSDELEYALIELEETFVHEGVDTTHPYDSSYYDEYEEDDEDDEDYYSYEDDDYADYADYADEDEDAQDVNFDFNLLGGYEEEDLANLDDMNTLDNDLGGLADIASEKQQEKPSRKAAQNGKAQPSRQEKAIVSTQARSPQVIEVPETGIQTNVLNITAEDAWGLIYNLIGYPSDYIQQTMLPRWRQYPDVFDKDRRFLYGLFIDSIRNGSGSTHIAGNYMFVDQRGTVDQLWAHYYADLAQQIAPQLAAARVHNAANDPWWKRLRQSMAEEFKNVSIIWIIALTIALIFDGLTTYISLDQTPMEGFMVLVFTILITALFQIADQLVISYRKREFEAEAFSANFQAQFKRLTQTVENLEITSESYVQMSMDKSRAHADWKAAEDNRKMARRGRFWSARIADINVIVTAYGFAFMFLNSEEPMQAIFEQIQYVVDQAWANVDLWVFLMVGLAVTVSFVVNTAQRTEILGWSMRRLKREN